MLFYSLLGTLQVSGIDFDQGSNWSNPSISSGSILGSFSNRYVK